MKSKVLFSASLFHGLNDASAVTVPMVFPLLFSQQFIITKYSHIGILSNLGLFTTFLFQLAIANYAHKFKFRYMLLLSVTGISASLFLITKAEDLSSLLCFYLLMRVFTSVYHPIGIATVSRTHPDQGMDFAMGIQSGSGNFGVFSAFIFAGYIAQNFGWKMPLYVCAVVSFSLGIMSFYAVRNISVERERPIKPDISAWIETIKNIKSFIPGFVYGGACWGATVYYAPSLFNHKFRVPLGNTGVFLAFWIGIGTIMTYFFGYLSSRLGRKKVSYTSLIGSTLCLFLLGTAQNLGIAVVGLFLFGFFLFLIFPSFQSYVGNKVTENNQVLAFSFVANIQMLTGSIVVLVSGFLSDWFGINSPFILITILGAFVSAFYLLSKHSPLLQRNC